MPLPWSDADRVVAIVLDQSGSMSDLILDVRRECEALAKTVGPRDVVQYIVFDDVAHAGVCLADLPSRAGSTNIFSGFKKLHCLLKSCGTPRRLDVVFISDGEDQDMDQCKRDLDGLPAPRCPSRLFSVGVRSLFPTGLVTDHLYPKFGRQSDVSTPPVLPLESGAEAPWVFEQLGLFLNDAEPRPPPGLEDFTVDTPVEALHAGAKQVTPGHLTRSPRGRGHHARPPHHAREQPHGEQHGQPARGLGVVLVVRAPHQLRAGVQRAQPGVDQVEPAVQPDELVLDRVAARGLALGGIVRGAGVRHSGGAGGEPD